MVHTCQLIIYLIFSPLLWLLLLLCAVSHMPSTFVTASITTVAVVVIAWHSADAEAATNVACQCCYLCCQLVVTFLFPLLLGLLKHQC